METFSVSVTIPEESDGNIKKTFFMLINFHTGKKVLSSEDVLCVSRATEGKWLRFVHLVFVIVLHL